MSKHVHPSPSTLQSAEIHGGGITFVGKPEFFELTTISSSITPKEVGGGLMEVTIPKGHIPPVLRLVGETAMEAPRSGLSTSFVKQVARAARQELGVVTDLSRIGLRL